MITVAATYLHITRYIHEEPDFLRRRTAFEKALLTSARELYGKNFDVHFSLDEGGAYLNALVGVAALTTILSQGPDALDNVAKYGKKAVQFGTSVIEEVYKSFGVSEEEVDWKQRRMGDAKKILSIAKNSQIVKRESLSRKEKKEVIYSIERVLYQLSYKVENIQELAPILKALPHDVVPSLPRKPEEIRAPVVALPPRKWGTAEGLSIDSHTDRERLGKVRHRRRIYETTLTT